MYIRADEKGQTIYILVMLHEMIGARSIFLSLSFWKSLNPFTHTATAMRLKPLNMTMLVGTTSITVENRNSQGYM